jgi:hypothetical protein
MSVVLSGIATACLRAVRAASPVIAAIRHDEKVLDAACPRCEKMLLL